MTRKFSLPSCSTTTATPANSYSTMRSSTNLGTAPTKYHALKKTALCSNWYKFCEQYHDAGRVLVASMTYCRIDTFNIFPMREPSGRWFTYIESQSNPRFCTSSCYVGGAWRGDMEWGMLDVEWVRHDRTTPGFLPDSLSEQGSRAVQVTWHHGQLGH